MTSLGNSPPTPPPGSPPLRPLPPTHSSVSRSRENLILALHFVLSQKEYAALRKVLKFRAPSTISSSVPSRREFDAVIKQAAVRSSARSTESTDTVAEQDVADYNFLPSVIRATFRTFILVRLGLGASTAVERLLQERKGVFVPRPKYRRFQSPATRSALSLSLLVFLHRLLSHFFTTLRSNLLLPSARTFRKRHPKATRLLTSRFAPALGASLAGVALAVHPADKTRSGIAVWVASKAVEYAFNLAEARGVLGERPWWFGSWLLYPVASAQLFHALIFDRDTLPDGPTKFILNYSDDYIPPRPSTYPTHLRWLSTNEILDGVADISVLRYPKFTSPVIHPPSAVLPPPLSSLTPITSAAHPLHTRLHCALTHPFEPSCLTTFITHILHQFPRLGRFFFILYLALAVPRIRSLSKNPVTSILDLIRSSAASAAFVTGATGTTWAVLCALQRVLPGKLGAGRSEARVYLAGAVGGLWAFVQAFGSLPPSSSVAPSPSTSATKKAKWDERHSESSEDGDGVSHPLLEASNHPSHHHNHEQSHPPAPRHGSSRAVFTYATRLAIVSLWQTGVKRRWWKPLRNGDIILFITGLAAMAIVWEAGGDVGVYEAYVRRGLELLKGGRRVVDAGGSEQDEVGKRKML